MKYGIRSAEYLLKEKSQEDGYFPIVVYISREDLVNKEMITQAKVKKVTDEQMAEVADTMEVLFQVKPFWSSMERILKSVLKR
jgi:hypothetical protein